MGLLTVMATTTLATVSAQANDLDLFYDADDILITSTQSRNVLNKAPAIATVLNASQLRRSGARTLFDALKVVPGMHLSHAPRFTTEMSLTVRGLKTDDTGQVLLMIDGHRVNDPHTNNWTLMWSDLPLDAVQRIEVIRGPGSALYGANAFVAVINVIMKKPGSVDKTSLSAALGNIDQWQGGGVTGWDGDDAGIIASYRHTDSNGSPEFVPADAFGNSGVTNYWNTLDMGYARTRVGGLSVMAMVGHKRRGSPLSVTNTIDTKSNLLLHHGFSEVSYQHQVDSVSHSLRLSVDDIRWDLDLQTDMGSFPAPFTFADVVGTAMKERTLSAEWQSQVNVGNAHLATVGISVDDTDQSGVVHILDGVDVSALANHTLPANRKVWALYAQDEWDLDDTKVITVGARWDHYDDFGSTWNPRLALVWSPDSDKDIKFLYGRAFRAPSFWELYARNNPVAVGNPDLEPERVQTWEGGFDWRLSDVYRVSINAYLNRYTDRIERSLLPSGPGLPPQTVNRGGANMLGTEWELTADWHEHHYAYLNWSWVNPEDRDTDLRLPGVATHQVKAGVNHGVWGDRINTHVALRWVGQQGRSSVDPRPMTGSYTVVDLAVTSASLIPGIDLSLSVDNLLDRSLTDPAPIAAPPFATVASDFPQPGRTWLLEAKHEF